MWESLEMILRVGTSLLVTGTQKPLESSITSSSKLSCSTTPTLMLFSHVSLIFLKGLLNIIMRVVTCRRDYWQEQWSR